MSFEIAEIDRRLAASIQAGTIEAVDYPNARCRVLVADWVSAWLPWITLAAGQVRHWRPPSVGEQAVIVSPSGEAETGFVLPGFYTTQHSQANDNRRQIVSWLMPDGALFEYDWEAHFLHIVTPGEILVDTKGPVTLNSEGDVTINTAAAVTIKAVDNITLQTAAQVNILAANNVSIQSAAGSDTKISVAGNAEVRSTGFTQYLAEGEILIKSNEQVRIQSPRGVSII